MKKFILPALAVIALAVTFNSCSMEKRHYMKGYYIDRNNHKEITANPSAQNTVTEQKALAETAKSSPAVTTVTTAENGNNTQMVTTSQNSFPVVFKGSARTTVETSTKPAAVKSDKVASRPVVSKGNAAKKAKHPSQMPDKGLLIVLAILIPWLAVGLATDWDVKQVIINLLLCLTCIGGIIHALIVVSKNA